MATSVADTNIVYIFGILFVVIALVLICSWLYRVLYKNNKNCNHMNKIYPDFPTITNIDPSNKEKFCHSLRDYYVKTAYNCCSAGDFKNDYVNLCALKACIRQGARCLDFAVYSIDNKPVIAVSSQTEYFIKESWNYVPFTDAMNTIAAYAFSGSTCPNPNDPLILHFRVMSNNTKIYDIMANDLGSSFKGNMLLDPQYSYESNGENIGAVPIIQMMNKVIIIVDKINPMFEGTELDEYVNIASNSIFMRALTYHDVQYTPDMNELIEFNRKNMTICLPDLNESPVNPSAPLVMSYGCQFIAMSFQKNDTNMTFYNDEFNTANSAFILKPINLRYIPVNIAIPPPPAQSLSYEKRDLSADYYNYNI
jgi:hypothetical protein